MGTTKEAQEKAYDEFVKQSAGWQVDTTGLPSVQARQRKENSADDSLIDPRFAPLAQDRPVRLRNEIVRFVNANGRDAEVKRILEKEGIENPSEPNTVILPGDVEGRVFYKDGSWQCVVQADGARRTFVGDSYDIAVVSAARAFSKHRASDIRDLTEAEKLEVIRYSQLGMTQEAIGRYVYFAINKREIDSAFEILDDPRYRPLCDAAVWFVWTHAKNDYAPTPEREEFIKRFVAERPLTLALLDSAWTACQSAERDAAGSLKAFIPPNEPEPTQHEIARGLEDLPDDEVRSLLGQTLRAYSREVKQGVR
ncbi:MAG TPA: hypothetical protein VEJ46_04815 [Candidatus Acidoferrum sp.]|nr:hypothetical protein [Candidatus Acidoferrum sp.]